MGTSIPEAMKMNPDSYLTQGPDPIIGINHPTIIRRIGDIQRDNMEILVQLRSVSQTGLKIDTFF